MSKAEKYLPFILALTAPAISAISNNDFLRTWNNEFPLTVLKYIQASVFLLVIWFFNKYLINTDYALKRKYGLVATSMIANAFFISVICLIDYLIPEGLTEELSVVVLFVRLSLVTLIFNVILSIFNSQRERVALEVQNLELQAENLKFQMETLKQQINPHFLFNSLNTLLDLIEEDKDAAIKYVRNFSKLYRMVLQSIKLDFIPLRDEIEFLTDYWSLLKVRFNDSIDLKLEIEQKKMEALIPPLSLQFLVENAVKHNEATKNDPLVIEIFDEDNSLVVRNRMAEKSFPVPSEKVGLKNLQERFMLLCGPIEYGVDSNFFVVRIPLKIQ